MRLQYGQLTTFNGLSLVVTSAEPFYGRGAMWVRAVTRSGAREYIILADVS